MVGDIYGRYVIDFSNRLLLPITVGLVSTGSKIRGIPAVVGSCLVERQRAPNALVGGQTDDGRR